MSILDDLTYNQKVLGIGGATVGGLGATTAYQSMQDIKAINQMAKMGNYGTHNPMPQAFMDKLKGAYTPSSVFKKTGYPAGLKDWFFSRSSPEHFGPVEKTMKFAKNLPGYAMKGLGYLSSLPVSAALMSLHSTPVGSAEMPAYGSAEYKAMVAREALFRRKQKQANVFKQMKQKQLADEAAKKKVITGGPPGGGDPGMTYKKKITTGGPPSIISRPTPSAPIRTGGPPSRGGRGGGPPSQGGGSPRGGQRGRNPWGRADGGLIDFYRDGGFI